MILGASYDLVLRKPVVISIDPDDGSYENAAIGELPMGPFGMAVVPLRGDVDADKVTDLEDLELLTACMNRPGAKMGASCDLADMDADGDVDLFDVRFFELGYTAFAEP